MTEREELIELLLQSELEAEKHGIFNCHRSKPKAEIVADYLLENGVIVLSHKIGDKVYRINECAVPQLDSDGKIICYEIRLNVVESTLKRSDILINEVYLTREEAERYKELSTQAREYHRILI